MMITGSLVSLTRTQYKCECSTIWPTILEGLYVLHIISKYLCIAYILYNGSINATEATNEILYSWLKSSQVVAVQLQHTIAICPPILFVHMTNATWVFLAPVFQFPVLTAVRWGASENDWHSPLPQCMVICIGDTEVSKGIIYDSIDPAALAYASLDDKSNHPSL